MISPLQVVKGQQEEELTFLKQQLLVGSLADIILSHTKGLPYTFKLGGVEQ